MCEGTTQEGRIDLLEGDVAHIGSYATELDDALTTIEARVDELVHIARGVHTILDGMLRAFDALTADPGNPRTSANEARTILGLETQTL